MAGTLQTDEPDGMPGIPQSQTWAAVIARKLEMVLLAMAGSALVFIGFLIVAQVFFRYVLAAPPSWTEELTRYVFVWMAWLSAAVVFRWGQHVTIDALSPYIPKSLEWFHGILIKIVCAAILIFLMVYGFQALEFTTSRSAALGIDMRLVYLSAPVASLIMLAFLALDFIDAIVSKRTA